MKIKMYSAFVFALFCLIACGNEEPSKNKNPMMGFDAESSFSRNLLSSAAAAFETSSYSSEISQVPMSLDEKYSFAVIDNMSSTIDVPMSSESSLEYVSSSEHLSSSEYVESSVQASAAVSLDAHGFATMENVYKSLDSEEKVVFIIRHSEREDAVTLETELTANGIEMAKNLGASLKLNGSENQVENEPFFYATSNFVRTNETANYISEGRGEKSAPKLTTLYDLAGNWFLKTSADSLAIHASNLGLRGSSVELMSRWAYGEDYSHIFYDLNSRAEEFVQNIVVKNMPKWNRVNILVSHDILVMPLAVFGSQGKVALKYHEDYHWINYLAGLAIILDSSNNVLRYVPVKGADSGIIDYLAIYMESAGHSS
ncbi:MAG: histidine phosphatase family protein [Fibrobacteraceae bacterium]|nr:histidine phosphatase family protein [Fibrobacteraceae bacterium]